MPLNLGTLHPKNAKSLEPQETTSKWGGEGVCLLFMLHISFGLKYRLNLIKNAIPVSDFHGLVDRREFDHIKIVDNIIKSRKKFLM